ncbi:MAG: hypothetical protein JSR66_17510 [Proteobacteria bacterium]|nr:hypothetical protein [Pseudomonadota bacterium]
MNGAVWFAAGVATGIAAAVAAVPLWRALAVGWRAPAMRYALAIGAIVLCMIGVLATQLQSSPPHNTGVQSTTQTSRPAPSLDAATAGLAQRLKEKGGTRDEWLLLARSYEFMGRTAEAKQARDSAEFASIR